MALLVNKKYLKITGIYINYIDNSTLIITKYYKDEENRIREKNLLPKVETFRSNALDYLNKLGSKLYDEVYEIVKDDSKIMEYALNSDKYKDRVKLQDELLNDYNIVLFNTLNINIDKTKIKHLDIWYSLGFSDEMINKIEFCENEDAYTLDYIISNIELGDIYNELKKLLPNSIDC